MSIGRRFYTDSTISKHPARSIAVNSSIDANLGVITFTLNSNLTPGLVLNYNLPNVSASDFAEGSANGTITVNGSGSATVTRTLNKYTNYSNTNVSSRLEITSPAGTPLVNSANFVIAPAVPFSATGGNISTVGANVIHTFSSTANLVVSSVGEVADESVRILIVGGGGKGSAATSFNEVIFGAYNAWNRSSSGGGGAGGVLQPNLSVSAFNVTTYPITVGLGGRQPVSGENDSVRHGANTVAFGYTAIGGGTSSVVTQSFMDGGSGGGGSSNTQFGVGTVGQGNNGGTGATYAETARTSTASGGGGGASTAGQNVAPPAGASITGGNGGIGVASDITGSNVTYAGGGGGGGFFAGAGGAGGGGAGGYFGGLFNSSTTSPGANATNGLGGGGGGAGMGGAEGTATYQGGNGGSGAVIVAYRSQYRVLKPA